MTIHSVGRRLGWSGSKLSRIETSLSGITPGDAARLLDIYNVTGPRRDWMLALASGGSPRAVRGYFQELEADAVTILGHEATLVPGILQIPEYLRVVIQSHRPDATQAETESVIAGRLARQAILTKDNGPTFHLIVDEAILRRPVGGETVMRAQLRRMLELMDLPSVTLQVFTFDAPAHPAPPHGAFTVLQFRDDLDPGIVSLEHQLDTYYLDDPKDVDLHIAAFHRLVQHALDPDASAKLLAQLATG